MDSTLVRPCTAYYVIPVRLFGSLPAKVPHLDIRLPPDSTSRWTPLPSVNASYCRARSGLSPPSCYPCRAHNKNACVFPTCTHFCCRKIYSAVSASISATSALNSPSDSTSLGASTSCGRPASAALWSARRRGAADESLATRIYVVQRPVVAERAVQLGSLVGQQLQKCGRRDFVLSRECLHRKALLPQNAHGCGGVTASLQPSTPFYPAFKMCQTGPCFSPNAKVRPDARRISCFAPQPCGHSVRFRDGRRGPSASGR